LQIHRSDGQSDGLTTMQSVSPWRTTDCISNSE
jgi:hypothetical protein